VGESIQAVRVHLTGSDVPLGQGAGQRRRLVAVMHTVFLTSSTPVALVCGRDPSREVAYVQALTADVTLCTSKSNAAAGEGAVLPHTNTAPTPVEGGAEIWAYAGTVPAQVSVIECTRAPQES
jgi:hypothetical protein